jgi:hypothetical protein
MASRSLQEVRRYLTQGGLLRGLDQDFPRYRDRFNSEGTLRAAVWAVLWGRFPGWDVQAEVSYDNDSQRCDIVAESRETGEQIAIEVKFNPTWGDFFATRTARKKGAPKKVGDVLKLERQVGLKKNRIEKGVLVTNCLPPFVDQEVLDGKLATKGRTGKVFVVVVDGS